MSYQAKMAAFVVFEIVCVVLWIWGITALVAAIGG